MNRDVRDAALALVGNRFRLHGRDPATGLDCVGVVAAALRGAGLEPAVPQGYSLRMAAIGQLASFIGANRLIEVPDDGDILLARVNPVQPHLLVRVGGGFVHAHAGIGRVTFLPGDLPWPVACQWRAPTTRT